MLLSHGHSVAAEGYNMATENQVWLNKEQFLHLPF